jgi:very-short-patch-repair endonuclease
MIARDLSSPWKGEVGAKRRVGVSQQSRFSRTPEKTERARELRRAATPQEKKLWLVLKNGQREGASFRKQHPVGPFFLDFYCPSLQLAIEVDGGQHSEDAEMRRDAGRSGFLASKGILVIRVWNNEVDENLDGVQRTIDEAIAARRGLTPTGASRHLPLSGGGKKRGDR